MHFTGNTQQQLKPANEKDAVLEVPALVEFSDSVLVSKVFDKLKIASKAESTKDSDELRATPKKILLPDVALTDDQASTGTNNWFIRLSKGLL